MNNRTRMSEVFLVICVEYHTSCKVLIESHKLFEESCVSQRAPVLLLRFSREYSKGSDGLQEGRVSTETKIVLLIICELNSRRISNFHETSLKRISPSKSLQKKSSLVAVRIPINGFAILSNLFLILKRGRELIPIRPKGTWREKLRE